MLSKIVNDYFYQKCVYKLKKKKQLFNCTLQMSNKDALIEMLLYESN